MSGDLELIQAAAIKAGEIALSMRGPDLAAHRKDDGSPVTEADLAVDRWLRAELMAARPDYGWLSEETLDDEVGRLGRKRLFVVDPIDGTRDFLRGRRWWGVSIAVVEDGRPIAGVVRAPDVDQTFTAAEGSGAWLNGAPIHASTVDALEDCRIIADAAMLAHPAWAEPWPPMRTSSRNSVACRLCGAAAGEVDAVLVMSGKHEWDVAAGDLIAREAGCLVTDHKGRRLAYNRPGEKQTSLVCAGAALQPLILRRVRPIGLAN